ncbi:MAG: hypothetical protein GXP62_02455 [Oligoflexia bacterium]|nr:hypothetical protein [Oligoflexia bacterium]
MRWAPLLGPALLVLSCKSTSPSDTASLANEPVYWSGEDQRPALDHSFFTRHDLGDLSLFAHCEEGPEADRPDAAHRGPLAVGNGRVFGLLGLGSPLSSLHSMTGPSYDKGTRFFGDHWLALEIDGVEVPLDRECIARPRGTSIVVTRADAGDVTLYTVDVAPAPTADPPLPVIARFLLVDSASAHRVRLVHHAFQTLETVDGAPAEWINDERLVVLRGLDEDGSAMPTAIDLGTVQGETESTVTFEFADTEAELSSLHASLVDADPQAWLDDSLAWWRSWSATGVQLASADPRVNDLYDSLRTTIKVQTNLDGGISPMSRYTGVWLRDTNGPVRFLLRAGLPDDAQAALDYLHACHVANGDYGNSCTGAIDLDANTEEPDWASLGEFSGRTAAEGPSYVPLAWLNAAAWTDDDSGLDERWDYLARGLLGQVMDAEGRQGFSGDETWRLFMNVSLGLDLEVPWQDFAWSANSSLLMRAAAQRLAEAGKRLGKDGDVKLLEARSGLADNALRTYFLQDEGWLTPFIVHTEYNDFSVGDIGPHPFEDVNLKALWAGALTVDDPLALSDLQTLLAWAGRGDGTIQSPAADTYAGQDLFGIKVEEGVCSGMVPGYTLWTLNAVGDPRAKAAFDALYAYVGPTGSYAEALLYDDLSALQINYDQTGAIGDIAARFRPWEGSINVDAMLSYLLGAEPMDGGARFRPHLPGHQPSLEASQLRVGACAGSLRLADDGRRRSLSFSASSSCVLRLEIPTPVPPFDLGGGTLITLPAGEQLVRFPDQQLAAGDSLTVAIEW